MHRKAVGLWCGSDLHCHAGILFYGDQAGNGIKASDFITYLHSKEDLQKFVNSQPTNILTIVDVSLQNARACVHIFPAVLALAKNFTGFAHFARIIADESNSTQDVIKDYSVVEVGCSCHTMSRHLFSMLQNDQANTPAWLPTYQPHT